MAILETIRESVIRGDAASATAGVNQALAEASTPDILNEGLIAAMTEVAGASGRRILHPEMLIAARALQAALAPLRPCWWKPARSRWAPSPSAPCRATCTTLARNGRHDAGSAGFAIKDLGTNTSPDKFVQAVKAARTSSPCRPADHDHALHEEHDRSPERGRAARQRQGHDRRRPVTQRIRPDRSDATAATQQRGAPGQELVGA